MSPGGRSGARSAPRRSGARAPSASAAERLSPRARAILDFIRGTQRRLGAPPTVREIGVRFGIRSTNGVQYHLAALERGRFIRRRPGRARGIALPPEPAPVAGGTLLGPGRSADGRGRSVLERGRRLDGRGRSTGRGVPILGRVAAGGPLLAAENIEGHFDAGRLARLGGDFALRIQGESMRGAGILPGDIVLVRSDPEPGDGEIVVALIGDEATVKRFRREPGRVVLQPENPDYAPLVLDESSPPLRILGRVVGVYRELA